MRAGVASALLVGAGGFLGALLRYGLASFLYRRFPLAAIPCGTLAVNALGCLLIGWLAGVAETRGALGPELRAFALVGLLGGFTTYSTFGYETFAMLREGELVRAGCNVAAQLVVGIGAVWAGFLLGSASR